MSLSDEQLERLERLNQLRLSGGITQSEFDKAKSQLLSVDFLQPSGAASGSNSTPVVSKRETVPRDQTHNAPGSPSSHNAYELRSWAGAWSSRTGKSQFLLILGFVALLGSALLLFLPYESNSYTCSPPLIQVFDKDDSVEGQLGGPNSRTIWPDPDVKYSLCRTGAFTRFGLGVGIALVGALIAVSGRSPISEQQERRKPPR